MPSKPSYKPKNSPRSTIRSRAHHGQGATEPATTTRRRQRQTIHPATAARCIAALKIDGGTTLTWRPPRGEHATFSAAFNRLRRELLLLGPDGREREHRATGCGLTRDLPIPAEWGSAPNAEVRVDGARQDTLVFYVEDTAHVTVRPGSIRLDLKAKRLWADGYAAHAHRWIQLCSAWVGLNAGLADSYAAGWRVIHLELCSDFEGIAKWRREDTRHFVGTKKERFVAAMGRAASDTIELGNRSSPVSWCLYDKTEQIAKVKGGDDSTYADTWRAGRWKGGRVRRVELRVNRRGLRFTAQDGAKVNLTDPAALAERARLAQLWAHHTHRVRLVLPTATRLHRAELDPRWVVIQGASSLTVPPGWRQDRIGEAVAAATIANRRRLAVGALIRAAARVEAHTPGGLRYEAFAALGPEAQRNAAILAFDRRLSIDALRDYAETLRRVDGAYAAWPAAQALLNSPPSAASATRASEEKTNENKHLVDVCPADKWRIGSVLQNAAPNPEAELVKGDKGRIGPSSVNVATPPGPLTAPSPEQSWGFPPQPPAPSCGWPTKTTPPVRGGPKLEPNANAKASPGLTTESVADSGQLIRT